MMNDEYSRSDDGVEDVYDWLVRAKVRAKRILELLVMLIPGLLAALSMYFYMRRR